MALFQIKKLKNTMDIFKFLTKLFGTKSQRDI